MEWQKFIKNFINSLEVEDVVKNSLKNYHVKGVDSIHLVKRDELSIKIFVIQDTVQLAQQFFKVLMNPHSHAKSFHAVLLDGKVDNHMFEYELRRIQSDKAKMMHESFNTYNEFRYITKERDPNNVGFVYETIGNLSIVETKSLTKFGDTIYVKEGVIHALVPTGKVMMLILDYHSNKSLDPIYYSQNANPIEDRDLNLSFTEPEIINYINMIDGFCSKTNQQLLGEPW